MIHYAGAAMSANIARDLAVFSSQGPGPAVQGAALPGPSPALSFASPAIDDCPTEASSSGNFISNDVSRAIHWLPKGATKTRCGWPLATATVSICICAPTPEVWHLVCDRCLPELRDRLIADDLQADSEES